jgi:site-specific recombinase XerD
MVEPVFKSVRMSTSTLAQQYESFVRSLRGGKPETRGTYARALREFLRWFPRDRAFRFRVADVQRYKRYLTVRRKLTPVSVSTYLTALRRFCGFLVDRKVLSGNPAKFVAGNARPATHSREYLAVEDIGAVLAAVEQSDLRGQRDYAMILLMVRCALSEIELVRADAGDIALREGLWQMAVQGKGRMAKDALVPLPPEVKEAIDRYLATRGAAEPGDPLFASAGNRTRGGRMTTRGVRDRITVHLSAAGVRPTTGGKITPYSLRHTAAILMARDGATADQIRDRMRLGSLTTALVYLNHFSTDRTQKTPKE